MKKIIGIILLFVSATACAQNNKALLDTLDHAIAQSAVAVNQKEQRIAHLRAELAASIGYAQRYSVCYRLFEEMKAYKNDSALHYINRCINLAHNNGDAAKEGNAMAMMALQCSATGNYAESFTLLGGINAAALDAEGTANYTWAYQHLYNELAYYTKVPRTKAYYAAKAREYDGRALAVLSPTDDRYLQLLEVAARGAKRMDEAIRINDRRMALAKPGSHAYGIVCYYRALLFRQKGDMERCRYFLLKSAICDARLVVMDQGSMWELANMLAAEKGEQARSYSYIKFAWQAAETFNTALRSRQIMPVLSAIEDNYQNGLASSNQRLKAAVTLCALLLVSVLALLVFARRQNSKLTVAHANLKQANDSLVTANANLKTAYASLNESNRMKEMYIGRFLRLCSIYADKIETMRKKVARMVKNRELNKLGTLLQGDNEYIGELYEYFDSAFLNLFPNFVDEFNALLRPEERIVLHGSSQLTTQIRIFALIRLGIEDSSKIAEFLHYSVNTIYNYRAKVKNGALCDRELFEEKVKKIGMK